MQAQHPQECGYDILKRMISLSMVDTITYCEIIWTKLNGKPTKILPNQHNTLVYHIPYDGYTQECCVDMMILCLHCRTTPVYKFYVTVIYYVNMCQLQWLFITFVMIKMQLQ